MQFHCKVSVIYLRAVAFNDDARSSVLKQNVPSPTIRGRRFEANDLEADLSETIRRRQLKEPMFVVLSQLVDHGLNPIDLTQGPQVSRKLKQLDDVGGTRTCHGSTDRVPFLTVHRRAELPPLSGRGVCDPVTSEGNLKNGRSLLECSDGKS